MTASGSSSDEKKLRRVGSIMDSKGGKLDRSLSKTFARRILKPVTSSRVVSVLDESGLNGAFDMVNIGNFRHSSDEISQFQNESIEAGIFI